MTQALLKLHARDGEDIQIVSAILQDAIAPVCDMVYDAAAQSFIMVVHRLRREAAPDHAEAAGPCGLERICCAVTIQGVVKTQLKGIDPNDRGQILELLALTQEADDLIVNFAAGAKIRLQAPGGLTFIEDFGAPWPAQCAPSHDNPAP